MANLSGISRIYGGIHGNNANYAGLIIGECIARDILARPFNRNKDIPNQNKIIYHPQKIITKKRKIIKL